MDFLCPWVEPKYFLYSADAPILLYYSYLPILIISVFFAFYVLRKDKYSLLSKLVFLIASFFSMWILNALVEWSVVQPNMQMFSWQVTPFLEMPIYIFSLYFLYVFITKKDISFSKKIFFSLLFSPVIFLLPTKYNISFLKSDCGGQIGPLYYYVYGFEILSIIWIAAVSLKAIRKERNEKMHVLKNPLLYLFIGMFFFLSIFTFSNIFPEIIGTYQAYEFNLYGPLGMALFLSLLSFVIVKFKILNMKIIGAQILVIALCTAVGSLLFIRNINVIPIIISLTLLLVIILGILLVRSVKKEIRAREKIEAQEKDLELANSQQIILIHFITHQIKGFLSKSRNAFSMLLDGDYGELSPAVRSVAEDGLASGTKGVTVVTDILNAANIKKGSVQYESAPLDLKQLVEETFHEQEGMASSRGISFNLSIPEGNYEIHGDVGQLKHVFKNLMDNSIKYTPQGSVNVSLLKKDSKILFEVKDTGVGITDEDKKRLFTEGGRGIDSQKVNVDSTGYGLFIAKGIVEAHHGRVWAESEGTGKGSAFFVELPA